MANGLLREMGVWDKVQRAGFMENTVPRFISGDGRAEKIVVFADGYVPGLEMTYQVERSRFDAILLSMPGNAGRLYGCRRPSSP